MGRADFPGPPPRPGRLPMGMPENMTSQMMLPGHGLVMAGADSLLLLCLVGLVVFLLRPARTVPGSLMEFVGQQPTRSRFSTVETLPMPNTWS